MGFVVFHPQNPQNETLTMTFTVASEGFDSPAEPPAHGYAAVRTAQRGPTGVLIRTVITNAKTPPRRGISIGGK